MLFIIRHMKNAIIQVEVNNLAKLTTVTVQECFRYVQAGLRTIVNLCEQA